MRCPAHAASTRKASRQLHRSTNKDSSTLSSVEATAVDVMGALRETLTSGRVVALTSKRDRGVLPSAEKTRDLETVTLSFVTQKRKSCSVEL